MKAETKVNMALAPEDYRGFALDSFVKDNPAFSMADLASMGVTMDESIVRDPRVMEVVRSFAADGAGGLSMGEPTAVTPLQFAQFWLADPINALYRGRTADKIFGSENVGTWETEQIVATKMERVGTAALYDDFSKAPLANWNVAFETRDNVRFEIGIECTKLEEARASQMKLNAYQMKRAGLQLAMDVLVNDVKWLGFNGGGKKVYGVLNDPGLNGRATTWPVNMTKDTTSAEDIIGALNTVIQRTANDLMGNWNPDSDEVCIVIPLSWQTAFTKVNAYNLSARKWLAENYPKAKIMVAPEISSAIVFVRSVADVGQSVKMMDTSKLRLVGAVPTVKGFEESYSSSTAGALVRCPLAFRVYENAA